MKDALGFNPDTYVATGGLFAACLSTGCCPVDAVSVEQRFADAGYCLDAPAILPLAGLQWNDGIKLAQARPVWRD